MYPNRVGGIAATCAEAFRPYSPVLANLTGKHDAEASARAEALDVWKTNPAVDELIGEKLAQETGIAALARRIDDHRAIGRGKLQAAENGCCVAGAQTLPSR